MTHHTNLPLLATGSADHGVRVWDSSKSYCTHNLKGVHGAILTVLQFHPNPGILHLFSAAEDGTIAVWDLHTSRAMRALKGGHVSAVTALSINPQGNVLLSAGRDQVVNLWDIQQQQGSGRPIKTIAVLEAVEAAGWLNEVHFYTAGESGVVKVWDASSGVCIRSSQVLPGKGHTITQVKLCNDEMVVFTSDLFIIFISPLDLSSLRTMVGHHGEITDMAIFGPNLVLSTNGPQLRLYDRSTLATTSHVCRVLPGHDEAVISLAAASHSGEGSRLVSGSRDHTAIVWDENGSIVSRLVGHTDVVSAVAVGNRRGELVATASADMTLKMWRVNGEIAKLLWTVKAHDKDINCTFFTPNDKTIVTVSQDKTLKLWKVEDGSLIATFKGHRRGIWGAAISPAEQMVATASADRTIKLWSLSASSEYTCLKTLEGHANSVLRVQFIQGGSRLVSAGSDGLIKVWDVRRGECLSTIDAHADRIWTLITMANPTGESDQMLTGDASGVLKMWRDVSEERALSAQVLRDEVIIKEQELSNMILRKDYTNAILLAMQLEQPHRLFNLTGQLVDGRPIPEAISVLSEILSSLDQVQLGRLIVWIRDWNTSLKRAYVSQLLLHTILKKDRQLAYNPTIKEVLNHIQPYTEKHFEKIDELLIGSHLIDFVVNKIK